MKKIFTLAILGLFVCNSFECGKLSSAIKSKWNNSLTKAAADDISSGAKKIGNKISSGAKNLKNKISTSSQKTKKNIGSFLMKTGSKIAGNTSN